MSDGYLLLTPILMLVVVGVFGFVGCDLLFGLDEVPPAPPAPTGFTATAGDGKVTLTWDPYPSATSYLIKWRDSDGSSGDIPALSGETNREHSPLTNGTTYWYKLTAYVSGTLATTAEIEATPGVGVVFEYVTSTTLMGTNNALDGWVGMGIRVGNAVLTVRELGRLAGPTRNNVHRVKIVDAVTKMDIPNAYVDVNVSGAAANTFVFVPLMTSEPLQPNQRYYIVSREINGGDTYYQPPATTVSTQDDAVIDFEVYGDLAGSYVETPPTTTPATMTTPATSSTYGPVNFRYTLP